MSSRPIQEQKAPKASQDPLRPNAKGAQDPLRPGGRRSSKTLEGSRSERLQGTKEGSGPPRELGSRRGFEHYDGALKPEEGSSNDREGATGHPKRIEPAGEREVTRGLVREKKEKRKKRSRRYGSL